ncbi:putative integral membrane protein [Colletotrichum scovillei]|uniref:Integral membrane protein n=1 Tax=Colletotrichum scovillei TaxID=1209932 RepID=A0A9P7RES3_9PEZI|nr:putative integral membrane protein [Colletotrichum scovillei]KAG7072596.1 putative integral membrane protein [Colletotrichum scovillei]KAG7080674.1 putative integral membrane protein [Colletotrichum scovillei]
MADKLPSSIIRGIASLAVLFLLATIFLVLRIYTRIVQSQLAVDDYCLVVAWILFTAQLFLRIVLLSRATFAAILTIHELAVISKSAAVLCNLAWGLSKTSFVFTFMRLVTGPLRWVLWFIVLSMNLFIAVWLPLFLNPCVAGASPPCWPLEMSINLGIFVGAYSAFMDFFLSLLPWKIVWPMHLSTREKVGICVAMSMGIFAGATGVVKVIYLFGFDSLSADTLNHLFVWESAEISATIMAVSIPMLRKLAFSFKARDTSRSEDTLLSVFQRQLRIAGLGSTNTRHTTDQAFTSPSVSQV